LVDGAQSNVFVKRQPVAALEWEMIYLFKIHRTQYESQECIAGSYQAWKEVWIVGPEMMRKAVGPSILRPR